jgi:hypothetical protein
VYNTDNLAGQPGIILYKPYYPNTALTTTSGTINNSNVNDAVTRYIGSTSWHADAPKQTIESYLCTDGKPISTSGVYMGDDSMYAAFMNRDRRLYFTFVPPYRVAFKSTSLIKATGASDTVWKNPSNANYAYFINLMNTLPGYNTKNSAGYQVGKRIPFFQQTPDMASGNVIPNFPHFLEYPNSLEQPAVSSITQCVTETGYYFWKFYNRIPFDNEAGGSGNCVQDCPIFRIEEAMLNYAEAMADCWF